MDSAERSLMDELGDFRLIMYILKEFVFNLNEKNMKRDVDREEGQNSVISSHLSITKKCIFKYEDDAPSNT